MCPVIAHASPACGGNSATAHSQHEVFASATGLEDIGSPYQEPPWACTCWISSSELRQSLAACCYQLLSTASATASVPPDGLFGAPSPQETAETLDGGQLHRSPTAVGQQSVQLDSEQHLAVLTVWHELTASARHMAIAAARSVLSVVRTADDLSPSETTPRTLYTLVEMLPVQTLVLAPADLLWSVLHELAAAHSYFAAAAQLQASSGGVALVNVPSVQLPMGLQQRMEEQQEDQERCGCMRALSSPLVG